MTPIEQALARKERWDGAPEGATRCFVSPIAPTIWAFFGTTVAELDRDDIFNPANGYREEEPPTSFENALLDECERLDAQVAELKVSNLKVQEWYDRLTALLGGLDAKVGEMEDMRTVETIGWAREFRALIAKHRNKIHETPVQT